jgi:hypothetical protein
MGEEHFPYSQCQWGGNDETKRHWYEVLECTGPANVRGGPLAHPNALAYRPV